MGGLPNGPLAVGVPTTKDWSSQFEEEALRQRVGKSASTLRTSDSPHWVGVLFKNAVLEAVEDVTAVTSEEEDQRTGHLGHPAQRATALGRIVESWLGHGDAPLPGESARW